MSWLHRILPISIGIAALASACIDQQSPVVKVAATQNGVADSTVFTGAISATSAMAGTQIKISWNPSSDPALTGYRLYAVGENGTLTKLVSPIAKSATSYTHGGRTPGQLYRYVVRSLSGTKELDENMSIVSAVAYAGVTSHTSVSYHAATLTFPSVSSTAANALKVICSYRGGPDELLATAPVTSTFYTLTGLRSGTTYTCKVVPENIYGVDDASTITTTFQTTPYTATEFQNVVAVQALGPAPFAPNAEAVYSIAPNDPTDLHVHNTTNAKPFVRVGWNAFTNATTTTRYFLFRVARNSVPDFTAGANTECTSSTTGTCLVCTYAPTTPGLYSSCVDMNIASSPAYYDYYITRAASTVSSTQGIVTDHPEEVPSATFTSYQVAVPIPPDNMALVHRESANYEMCKLMGKTPDPLNKNRCPYNGLGARPSTVNPNQPISLDVGYYDFGYHLFVDRWETGCKWTRAVDGGMCGAGGTPGDCYGDGVPPTDDRGVTGNIYATTREYHRRCFIKVGGTWAEPDWPSAQPFLEVMVTNEASRPGHLFPPIARTTPGAFLNLCRAQTIDGYRNQKKRLLRKREFVAAAAWPLLNEPGRLTPNQATTIEYSTVAGAHTVNGWCNSYGTHDHPLVPFNTGEHVGRQVSSLENVFPLGSNSTRNCVSRYGIQDIIGNVGEELSDTLGNCDGVSSCTGITSPQDSGNDDLEGIAFDNVEAMGHVLNQNIQANLPAMGINYFSAPLGIGLFHDDGGNALLIGTDITSSALLGDVIRIHMSPPTDATANRNIVAGGKASSQGGAGRWYFWTNRHDVEVSAGGIAASIGSRCAYGIE